MGCGSDNNDGDNRACWSYAFFFNDLNDEPLSREAVDYWQGLGSCKYKSTDNWGAVHISGSYDARYDNPGNLNVFVYHEQGAVRLSVDEFHGSQILVSKLKPWKYIRLRVVNSQTLEGVRMYGLAEVMNTCVIENHPDLYFDPDLMSFSGSAIDTTFIIKTYWDDYTVQYNPENGNIVTETYQSSADTLDYTFVF